MWDYLYQKLVTEKDFLQSVANIATPLGIFLGIFSFWYSRRKDKLNNKPIIEFLNNEFLLEIDKQDKTDKDEIIIKNLEQPEKQTFNFCIKCSNQGLNSLFIKKITIKKIANLKYKRNDFSEVKTMELQNKTINFPIFHTRYYKDLHLEIINSNSTSLVRISEDFKILLHPIINHFVLYHALTDYFGKGIVSKDDISFTQRFKEIYLLTVVIKYNDINNNRYRQKIDVFTNIQPEESKYKLRIICKRR